MLTLEKSRNVNTLSIASRIVRVFVIALERLAHAMSGLTSMLTYFYLHILFTVEINICGVFPLI